MVERAVWDRQAAGSLPVTSTDASVAERLRKALKMPAERQHGFESRR